MTSGLRTFVILALLAAPVHAGSPELAVIAKLSLPDRVERAERLAEAASTRGDAATAAAFLIEACSANTFITFDVRAAVCVRAEAAARALPTTYLLARHRVYQSAIAAWSLDWAATYALADEAERLAAGGPTGDELAGEVYRGLLVIRAAAASEAGELAGVERQLAEMIALAQRAGDITGLANGEAYRCRFRRRIGQFLEAMTACDEAIRAARSVEDPFMIATALWNRGALESDRRDLAAAAATLTEAIEWTHRAVMPFLTGTLELELALALVELGRLDDARDHLAILQTMTDRGVVPAAFTFQARLGDGRLALARGDLRAAIASFELAQSSPIDGVATDAFAGEAEARHRLGEHALAEVRYRTAIERIERARVGIDSAQRTDFLQKRVHVYRELVAVLWDRHGAGGAREAFAIAEAARARALLDAVGSAGLASASTKPLELEAVQRALPAGASLVMYVASDRRLFGFTITRDRIAMTALPGAGARTELAARVDLYRSLVVAVDDPSELAAPGRALYADLLAPLVGAAPSGTLVVAADGPLHGLPFDAIYRDRFLVEDVDVVMTPSGSLLAAPDATPATELLALTSPPVPPPLAPLAAGRAEVDAIQAVLAEPGIVLAGDDASEARFRDQEPDRFGVLHFATHAVVDDLIPLRSGLLLAPSSGDDNWLRADEIYRLRLGAALVVLSGCQTGSGHVSESEGPMSLARAFLHAGARNVIATLWDVQDRHAPAIARGLYRELAEGRSVGSALASTKRAAIRGGASPRVWAAWITVGAPSATVALVPAPGSHAMRYAWVLLGFGVVAIGAALVLRRVARQR